jgi:hypothetical protein
MAILDPIAEQVVAEARNEVGVRLFQKLIDAVLSLPEVKRVAWATESDPYAVWVLLEHEDLDQHELIHELADSHGDQAGSLPLQVHVVALDRVSEDTLPHTKMHLTR